MAEISNYFAGKVLDHMLRNQAFTPPTNVYVALYTALPTASTNGTEVSGGAYTRQSATFGAAANATIANTNDIAFPVATADWGTIVAFALCDSATTGAGNILVFSALDINKAVVTGDQPHFPIGDLTVNIQ
jgi:hypothetical protein